jgi:glycosyltransferase AglD
VGMMVSYFRRVRCSVMMACRSSRSPFRTLVRTDVPIIAALLVAAAAVRLPYLWDIPRFTDESNEGLKSLLVAHGRILPLTNIDPYIGPLWNYVLAGVFLATGPSLYTPRTIVALCGVLTVVPTYLLGRSLGGQAVGALAAAFLALCPAHIVVNSHIGWSNCITPLLTTLALWLTSRAVARAAPSGLAWAGAAWGLSLQTHPTAALFLPGVALYIARARPRWLRTAWPWLAVVVALTACSPLVIANVRSGFAGLDAGLRVQAEYAGGESLSWAVYGRRLGAALSLLADSMSGALSEVGPLRGPFGAPLGFVFLVLALLGLVSAMRRRDRLLVVAAISYCALLPVINARFEPSVPKARYIAPLFPLCYAAISFLVVEAYRRAEWPLLARVRAAAGLVMAARVGLAVVIVGLLAIPLVGVRTYYRQDAARGRTNADLYALIAAVNAARRPGDQILVDRGLLQAYTPGGGRLYEHLQFAAGVYGWNRWPVSLPVGLDDPLLRKAGLLIVADTDVGLALTTIRLQETDATPAEHGPARVFRILGPTTP